MAERTGRLLLAENGVWGPVQLRRWQVEEVEAYSELILANLEHLRRFVAWARLEPLSHAERRAQLEDTEAWESGAAAGVYAARVDGTVIGCGSLHPIDDSVTEIGYWVDRRQVGKGYATAIAAGLADMAFELPQIGAVEIHHDALNGASGRVAEHLGFVYTGLGTWPIERGDVLAGTAGLECRWVCTRELWESQRSTI